MPSASCGFAGRPNALRQSGPTLYVDIGLDASPRSGYGEAPRLAATHLPALIDTGTSDSCIDATLAANLSLPIAEEYATISGVHGPGPIVIYVAHIYVPDLQLVLSGQFPGVHLSAGGQPHAALIGRDLLQHCTMTYDGTTGDVVLSTPSLA